MLVGHLAVALGTKTAEPRVPLGAAVAAAFGLDLLWPILLLLGVETVRVHPGDTAFTNLAFDSYPWSHSLLFATVWSGLAMFVSRRLYGSWRIGAILGGLVLSHWVLDFITHRPDLPLWPGGPAVGLGLWNSIPATIIVEGLLFAAAIEVYRRAYPPRDAVGRWSFGGLVALTGIIWISGPFGPPPPSPGAIAVVGLALWLLPLWAGWIDRHRANH